MSLLVRSATLEDFKVVFSLFHQLWPNKELNEQDMYKVYCHGIESELDELFCAEFNGEVVGFCSYAIVNNFWQEGQIAYIYSMIVDGELRGKGIGTKLLEKTFETAKLRKCKKIELDSGFHREQAHKFYEKIGFEKRAYLFSKDL
jgi:ribosomal protein S18 acetylase RimI-like enzyme